MQFNILEHVLVPKHRILSNEEAEVIRQKYNISGNRDIPAISRFEPVSQVLGIRPDDLVDITRPSKTAITSYFYRICSQ